MSMPVKWLVYWLLPGQSQVVSQWAYPLFFFLRKNTQFFPFSKSWNEWLIPLNHIENLNAKKAFFSILTFWVLSYHRLLAFGSNAGLKHITVQSGSHSFMNKNNEQFGLPLSSQSFQRKQKAPETNLYPLFSVDLHTIGTQRSDGSVNDLFDHLSVPIGLLQLRSSDPDVAISGDILSSFVQDTTSVLIRL